MCPYCAVGCGAIAYVHGSGGLNTVNSIIHVEGDPDSPINGGTLCPKGAAQMQLAMSPRLQEAPLHREAGGFGVDRGHLGLGHGLVRKKFKDSRDASVCGADEEGRTVNRCEGIGWVG